MYGPGDEYDDGECTADVGFGGWMGCHRWPGCGCGQQTVVHDPRTPDQQHLDYWKQELEGMLFSIDLNSDLPPDLAARAPKHRLIIKRQAAELTALLNKLIAEAAAARD